MAFDYEASRRRAKILNQAMLLQAQDPASPGLNVASLGQSPLIQSILQGQGEAPQPVLSEAGISSEADRRNQPLQGLVQDAENSYVKPNEGGMIDSIIRAIASGVSVGTSPNPGGALQQQLLHDRVRQERLRAAEQEGKDKVLGAKRTVAAGKLSQEKELRDELQTDKKLIFAQKESERKQKEQNEFTAALHEADNAARAHESSLSAERQAKLEQIRQYDNLVSRASMNTTSLLHMGVDPDVSSVVGYKMGHGLPLTPEEAAAIALAQKQNRADKMTRAAMSRAGQPKLLTPKDIESMRMGVFKTESSKLVPAKYGDENYPVDPKNPKKQQGMPVMKSDTDPFAGQATRRQTDTEASAKADLYIQDVLTRMQGSLSPELDRSVNEFYTPQQVSLDSLGPLKPEGEKLQAFLNTGATPAQAREQVDASKKLSPDMKNKLKQYIDALSRKR
jgi:hypothetical protein